MKKIPFCSIIILNYNGFKILPLTLNSVLNINYPKDKYEIIIVDNNSSDSSRKIIKKYKNKYNNIHCIYSNKNLGFAKGNNLAISKSNADYVVLLNNDCIVDKNWLNELVKIAESNEKIFSVGSKLILYPKFVKLKCSNNRVEGINVTKSNIINIFKQGKIEVNKQFDSNSCIFDIPFDHNEDKDIEIEIFLNNIENIEDFELIHVDSNKKFKFRVLPSKVNGNLAQIKATINVKNLSKYSFNKIQNAGSVVFQNGYSRDIGAMVDYGSQDYEIDSAQFSHNRNVFSTCGASCLYNKKIIDKIGSLDNIFFMYYEDTELCWRARNYGYKNIWSSKSLARHLHSYSSKEWSDSFIYNSERSRLICLFYSAPSLIFIKEYLKFLTKAIARLFHWEELGSRRFIDIKIAANIFINLPELTYKKIQKYKYLPASRNNIKSTYSQIYNGEWLLERKYAK